MRTKYVADDGTEFADRDACERYEDQVDFIRIMVDTIRPKLRALPLQKTWEEVDGIKYLVVETFNYMMANKESIRGFLND